MAKAPKYCGNCGIVAKPKKVTKGSFWIEVFLWLALILPGVLYSLWRLTSRYEACPKCGAPNMLPLDSPIAKTALAVTAGMTERRTDS